MPPLWRCRGCGTEWPCQPARLALLVEYRGDRTGLLVYLAALMAEASAHLSQLNADVAPEKLAGRFLGWARARGSDGRA
ncbi:flavin reductase [Micromonospora rifamycinica]|uniref:flavin reductase n=1 Tax=Micromonospora rifamycinica TaxID=291594 RepID=UPI002E2805F0|nr:flavin reductase [Micromonospora rifamycinica]